MSSMTRQIQARLLEMQDLKYRDFHAALMPTVDKATVIGVRVPQVRKLAKELAREEHIRDFLEELPHQYFEENNVHAFVIEQLRDYEECVKAVNAFLPYVDNWATCDMMAPKVFAKYPEELLGEIKKWMASAQPYTVRFGIGMLMRFYLDDAFEPAYLDMAAEIRSEEYYVNMMIAWYFATALAKQYEAAVPYLEEGRLAVWTHNKAIQKARESLRIAPEQKEYLKTLKRKA